MSQNVISVEFSRVFVSLYIVLNCDLFVYRADSLTS